MTIEEIKQEILKLEERIFYLDMKDHWTTKDYDLMSSMETDLKFLQEKLRKKELKNGNNN